MDEGYVSDKEKVPQDRYFEPKIEVGGGIQILFKRDIEEVLIHILKIENPYSSVGREYKDFEFLYDTAFEKLVKSDANIGIEELKDLVEDNIENPSDDNPYSFLWSDEIIQNLNR